MHITCWKVALPGGSRNKTDDLAAGRRKGWAEFVTVSLRWWRKRVGAFEVTGELAHSNITPS